MRLHICILMEYPTLNGGERSMLAVMEQLRGEQFTFSVLAPGTGRLADRLRELNFTHLPFSVRDANGKRFAHEEILHRLIQAVHQINPHLLHANSLAMGRLTGAVSPELSIPCLAHLRDILKLSAAAVNDLNQNQTLVAVSHATKHFHSYQGVKPSRWEVLYNGVDCRQFSPRKKTSELKRQLGLPDHSRLLLTVGQLGLRKGQNVLLQATPTILNSHPEVHFLLVGEQNSRKLESDEFVRGLRSSLSNQHWGDHVRLLGYREEIPWLMNECDLLVHPANQEPLGRVLLEAGASGLPIVATDVGGTPEILTDCQSALLVPPHQPEKLAIAILTLLNHPERGFRLAEEARKVMETRFSLETAAANLGKVWWETVSGEPPGQSGAPSIPQS